MPYGTCEVAVCRIFSLRFAFFVSGVVAVAVFVQHEIILPEQVFPFLSIFYIHSPLLSFRSCGAIIKFHLVMRTVYAEKCVPLKEKWMANYLLKSF